MRKVSYIPALRQFFFFVNQIPLDQTCILRLILGSIMDTTQYYITDQNGDLLFPEAVSASMWHLITAFPFAIKREDDGEILINVRITPGYVDPRCTSSASQTEIELIAGRTRAIVESIIHEQRPDLVDCLILDKLLDDAQFWPFYPNISHIVDNQTNTEIYDEICRIVIKSCDEFEANI